MIEKELLEKLNALYSFSKPVALLEKVQKGNLSENFILTSGSEKFFLKKYRFDRERIAQVHAVKQFFSERGISVILPLKTTKGRTFFEVSGSGYALFPFINGKEILWEDLSSRSLKQCGKQLAILHLQSKEQCPNLIKERSFSWNLDIFTQKVTDILEKISQEPVKSEFSLKADKLLREKIALAKENTIKFEDFKFKSDHIIHGDYHEQNIFFTEDGDVRYIFDWEKTNLSPRVLELARAVEFFSFYGVYSEENFQRAKDFIQAYHATYPISREEMGKGLKAWYLNQLHNSWVLEEHYLKSNSRADDFLDNTINAFEYHSKHVDEYIKKLQSYLK